MKAIKSWQYCEDWRWFLGKDKIAYENINEEEEYIFCKLKKYNVIELKTNRDWCWLSINWEIVHDVWTDNINSAFITIYALLWELEKILDDHNYKYIVTIIARYEDYNSYEEKYLIQA